MHILQLGPYPPPQGGVARNLLAIRDELSRNGDRCTIINTVSGDSRNVEKNVFHPRTPISLLKRILSLDYDVLHIHVGGNVTNRVLGLLIAVGILARRKCVLTMHSGGYAAEKLKTARSFSIEGFVFRLFSRIIYVNPTMGVVFQKFGVKPENARLIYPFVHEAADKSVEIPLENKQFLAEHDPILITVSNLEEHYDLPTQIEAVEVLRNEFPKIGLLIVGSGIDKEKLSEIITAKSLDRNILIAENLESRVVLRLIDQSNLFLRTTTFDGDAISIREALHLQTPVIATDNGMRPGGVYLIPMRNANALRSKIVELLSQERSVKIDKPDDRGNIEAVISLYREILNQSQPTTQIPITNKSPETKENYVRN